MIFHNINLYYDTFIPFLNRNSQFQISYNLNHQSGVSVEKENSKSFCKMFYIIKKLLKNTSCIFLTCLLIPLQLISRKFSKIENTGNYQNRYIFFIIFNSYLTYFRSSSS